MLTDEEELSSYESLDSLMAVEPRDMALNLTYIDQFYVLNRARDHHIIAQKVFFFELNFFLSLFSIFLSFSLIMLFSPNNFSVRSQVIDMGVCFGGSKR